MRKQEDNNKFIAALLKEDQDHEVEIIGQWYQELKYLPVPKHL